jgi:uncharacterized RDD family membrane protein YckC
MKSGPRIVFYVSMLAALSTLSHALLCNFLMGATEQKSFLLDLREALQTVSFSFHAFAGIFNALHESPNMYIYLQFLAGFLFMVGVLFYQGSNYQSATLIRFFWLLIFAQSVAELFATLNVLFFIRGAYQDRIGMFFISTAARVLWIAGAYICLHEIDKRRGLQIFREKINGADEEYFIEAKRGKRLLNLVADMLLFALISYPILRLFAVWNWNALPQDDGVFRWEQFIYTICYIGIFYIMCESIWTVTPGKILTGTRLSTFAGEKPGAAHIIGRTLLRFVPLEGFSFLGSSTRGWHDSFSGTYVVEEDDLEDELPEDFLEKQKQPNLS